MTTPEVELPGSSGHYGLGLIIDEQRGLTRIWHNGADTAHRAELLFFPEINAGVIALSNNGWFDSSVAKDVAALAEFVGTYYSEEPETVYTVAMDKDELVLRHRRLDDIELVPKVTDAFSASGASRHRHRLS